ncbi:MAG: peptidylprolyl isomerase [Planctomycetota bacterium]|nr:peptidylprolyl isomerase [Planctomycetota bacterium]MDP6520368.1 peptidylprolyl isomerase [Planctomycetota bacterium]MDP6838299.1 peptidylprolyl isomerase [Planctomycetota bacterium]
MEEGIQTSSDSGHADAVAAGSAAQSASQNPGRSTAGADAKDRFVEDGGAQATIALVAGQAVGAGELIAFWFQRDPAGVREMLEQLALSRLVMAEASRLGMVLAPEPVEAAWRSSLAELDRRIAREAPGTDTEDYIREFMGREPSTFREGLRQEILLEALASRVVRAWMLCEERSRVRVIVTKTEEDMDAVRTALAAGGDFAELARKHSQEESAADGGLLPPIVHSQTVLSRLAFLTEVGEVGGPVGEQGSLMLIRVEERPTPLEMDADWSVLGPAVEASLASNPVQDPEYWQWKEAIGRRYEVDFSPILDLVGEPVATENR